jgi:hypothetical protein
MTEIVDGIAFSGNAREMPKAVPRVQQPDYKRSSNQWLADHWFIRPRNKYCCQGGAVNRQMVNENLAQLNWLTLKLTGELAAFDYVMTRSSGSTSQENEIKLSSCQTVSFWFSILPLIALPLDALSSGRRMETDSAECCRQQ